MKAKVTRTSFDGAAPGIIKATEFQAVTFYDQELKKQIIMLYTLGADGIVREFNGGTWKPFPILKE